MMPKHTHAARRLAMASALWITSLAAPPASASATGMLVGEPVARRAGQGCEISFTLTAPSDVTVRILGRDGRVVRHLACGMVGLEKAASPFAPGRLAQRIAWDGKDDAGRAASDAGSTVLLGVAARARFDRMLLGNPDGFGQFGAYNWATPGAMAVGPRGELHLVEQYGVHFGVMRVLDREGKCLRWVWPFSLLRPRADIEALFASTRTIWPSDVAAWGATDWAGRFVPRSVRHSAFYWYSARCPSLAVGGDGTILFPPGTAVDASAGLHRIAPNGLPMASLPWRGSYPWVTKHSFTKAWAIAVAPDGDLYVSDKLYGVVAHLDGKGEKAVASFMYNGTEKLAEPSCILGRPDPGKCGPWDPLWGIAVDRDGAIWLADPRAECVRVYRKDGKLLTSFGSLVVDGKEIKLAGGVALAANQVSGAVYANVGPYRRPRKLVKLTSWRDPAPAAEMDLPASAKTIAADGEGGIVWVLDSTGKLIRVRDKGEAFEARTIDGLAGGTLVFPRLLAASPRGRLSVVDGVSPAVLTDVEGKGFQRVKDFGYGHDVGHGYNAFDTEDNWYVGVRVKDKGWQVWKFRPDGTRAPFGGSDALAVGEVKELKGLCVAGGGDLYVAVTVPAEAGRVNEVVGNVDARGDQYNFSRVDVYGPDGSPKKQGLVRVQGINDVKIDRAGHVYVIEAGTCHGAHRRRAAKLDNKRFSQYGKVFQFAPTGGLRDGEGHLWTFQGVSAISSYTCAGECHAAQLALDDDGRVWAADTSVYNVVALDGAGNLLFRVGAYGNGDSKGGGGDRMMDGANIVIDPEVPLAHPSGLAVWGDWLLISDRMAHRVLRCRLEYARKLQVPIR